MQSAFAFLERNDRACQHRIAIGKGAEGVTSAFGAIWAVAQDDGLLVRIDPTTRKVKFTL